MMLNTELEKIRLRVTDLRDFWSKWGYTEIEHMPIYMQDLIALLSEVDSAHKHIKTMQEALLEEASKNTPPEKIEEEGLDGRP